MSVTDFLGAIQSPPLRDIASHWNDARGAKRMPGWKNINPAAIARYLDIVWSWKYDREQDSFIGRLAGETIIDALGENLHGKRLQDFFVGKRFDGIFLRNRRIVTEPALVRETGHVFLLANRYGLGERIIMPLAADGTHGDGILGATIYSIDPGAPPPKATADRYQEATQTDFFALE